MDDVAVALSLPPDTCAARPAGVQILLLALPKQVAALRAENIALQTRVRDLESRVGQDSSNSSCRPSVRAAVRRFAGHASVQTAARYDAWGEVSKRKAAGLLHVPYLRRPAV